MKGEHMDEHDPRWTPEQQWEEDIPGAHWVLVVVAVGLILALLTG